MKANAPKRKIFNDAVDMLTDTSVAGANDVQMLPVDSIKTFRNHPFHLYEEMMDEIHSGKVNCVVVKDCCAIMGLNQKDLENQGILA